MTAPLAVAIETARRIGWVPLVLRAVVALGALIAVLATALPAWNVPDGYIVVAAVFAGVWAVVPDSHAGLLFAAAVGMAWLTGAPGGLGPAVVVVALGLLVAHVAAALAAAMPATARADVRLIVLWARPTAAIAAVIVGATAIVAAFDAWSPAGSIVVTLVALGLVTAAVWLWSTPPERG